MSPFSFKFYSQSLLTGLIVMLITSITSAQGFSENAINWSLPEGGIITEGINLGFNSLSSFGSNVNGSKRWGFSDINNDNKPDLIVYGENQSEVLRVFDVDSNPHWEVYLNTGTSFSETATNWTLPMGGDVLDNVSLGFNWSTHTNGFSSGNRDAGAQEWSLEDMNNDGMIDLVVVNEKQTDNSIIGFDVDSNPHWKVYLNTGTGFNTTPIIWTLPSGGRISNAVNLGFARIYGSSYYDDDNGSNAWLLEDMNSDGMLDLLVVNQKQGVEAFVFGINSDPYWKVYFNNGTGFSTTAMIWSLPTGGRKTENLDLGFNSPSSSSATHDMDSQEWTYTDLNNDNLKDLVVFGEKKSSEFTVFDPNSNPHWCVYLNTGTGFNMTPINWTLPSGGQIKNRVNKSYNRRDHTDFFDYDDLNSQRWRFIDFDNDGLEDLVVVNEKKQWGATPFDLNSNPYWKVYLNTGTKFSTTAINWYLPAGGYISNGTNLSFHDLNSFTSVDPLDINSTLWRFIDINNDAKNDLVILAEKEINDFRVFGIDSDPSWKVHLNTGTGFSTTAINWSLPTGGKILNGVASGFISTGNTYVSSDDIGSQTWRIFDINNNGTLDIIVFGEKKSDGLSVFDVNSTPHWKVYLDQNDPVLNVNQLENSSTKLKLYPNPTNDILQINSHSLNLKSVTIYNSSGQLIHSLSEINSPKINLSLENYNTGIYIVEVSIDDSINRYRIIRQ